MSGIKTLARILGAASEVAYPPGAYRGRCDLVFPDCPGNAWVESKFAWTYKEDWEPDRRNPNYRKHLLDGTQESAVRDVAVKLASLVGREGVDRVGFLLVAFHSIQLRLPGADIAELERLAGLGSPPWTRHVQDDWTNPRTPDCRIRAYYWERRSPDV